MAFMCHDQLSTSVKIPDLITRWWTLPMPPLPPRHHRALAPPKQPHEKRLAVTSLPPSPFSLPPCQLFGVKHAQLMHKQTGARQGSAKAQASTRYTCSWLIVACS